MRPARFRPGPPIILLVDDEPSLRTALGRVLKHAFDATVLAVGSNDEAMAALRGQDVDLIITDLSRGGGTGVEFIRAIRRKPRLRRVPLLVQSASAERLWPAARRAGARVLLAKPYSIETFVRAVDDLLPTEQLLFEPDVTLIELGTEMQTHDYKGTISLATDKERASLAKDVIAMANTGGGTIVVGVEEPAPGKFEPVGVSEALQAELETTRLFQALRPFMDPPIAVVGRRVLYKGRHFTFIDVSSGETELVMAARSHQEAGLHMGRIYGRTAGAESAPLTGVQEIRRVIDRIVEARIRQRKGS